MKTILRVLLGAVVAVLAWQDMEAGYGGLLVSYGVLTNSDVDKIWRKVQGSLQPGINFVTEEFGWLKEMRELPIDASLRTMEFPIELTEDRGITSLPEGGREAEPMSVNATDASVAFIHLNGRFTVSKLAKWAGQDRGGAGAIANQLAFQGKKKIEALGRVMGDMFYGYSTNYLAQTSTAASQASGTYTLLNGLGDSAIDGSSTAEKNYIANLFKAGDRVALVRAGALVTNAIGVVTAVTPATPSIAVTWAGSVTSQANDYLVLANGASGTTLAHTSYNRGFVGLRDIMKSTSIQGISSATVPNWSVAHSDTAAGRFTGPKWRKGLDEIRNYGHERASVVTLLAKGVNRDVISQYHAGVRFDNAMALEIDGEPRAKGRKFRTSRRVPPGMVMMFDQNRALRKRSIHDAPMSAPSWSGGKELIDDSGWIFAVETSCLMATLNRKLFAYWEAQTEI